MDVFEVTKWPIFPLNLYANVWVWVRICLFNASEWKRGISLGILHKWRPIGTDAYFLAPTFKQKEFGPNILFIFDELKHKAFHTHTFSFVPLLFFFFPRDKSILLLSLTSYLSSAYLFRKLSYSQCANVVKVFVVKYKCFSAFATAIETECECWVEMGVRRSVCEAWIVTWEGAFHVKMLWRVSNIRNIWFFGTKTGWNPKSLLSHFAYSIN